MGIAEDFENDIDTKALESRITRILFTAKDLLISKKRFNIESSVKDGITRIFTEKDYEHESFVFLFAICSDNEQRMLEIVTAGLKSLHKSVNTVLPLDETFVNELIEFLSTSSTLEIRVTKEENQKGFISLVSQNTTFELLQSDSMDTPALSGLGLSLCVFFAICGKTTSSNIDEIRVNDYGCITEWKKHEPEF